MIASLEFLRRGFARWHRYGLALASVFILGRLPAALAGVWALLPREVQNLWAAIPFLMGILAWATLLPGASGGGRRGRRRRLRAGASCALAGCLALAFVHSVYVVNVEGGLVDGGGSRPIAVLVGSQSLPASCETSAGSAEEFVKLNSAPDSIDRCWGAGRMKAVRSFAILVYFVTAGGLGSLVGLAWARRYEPLVEPEGTRVFLSYASEDEEKAASLAKALSDAGVEVFYAPESIRTAESFPKRIADAIAACRVGVILWSAAAESSAWVTWERTKLTLRNVEQKMPFEVVRLEDLEVPLELRDLHRIDALAAWRPEAIATTILRDTGVEKALQADSARAAETPP